MPPTRRRGDRPDAPRAEGIRDPGHQDHASRCTGASWRRPDSGPATTRSTGSNASWRQADSRLSNESVTLDIREFSWLRRARAQQHEAMSRRTIEVTPELMLRAYRVGLFPMAETRRGTAALLARPGAARHPAARRLPPVQAPAPHRAVRRVRGHLRQRLRRRDRRLRGRGAGPRGHLDQRRDRAPVPGAAPPGPRPFGRVLAGRRLVGGLYGVSLGGVFFGESMFSTCATPPRSRWCIWWRGCGWAASSCSTPSSSPAIWPSSAPSRCRATPTRRCWRPPCRCRRAGLPSRTRLPRGRDQGAAPPAPARRARRGR